MRLSIISCFIITTLFYTIGSLRLYVPTWKQLKKLTNSGSDVGILKEEEKRSWVSSIVASTVASLICYGAFHRPATAAVANLADVGIKEFLVKDGRQFLRLSIPDGEKFQFQSTSNTADLKTAQENLELVRLRFEQVGFTNPSAWGSALKDANLATNTIKVQAPFLLYHTESDTDTIRQKLFDDELLPKLSKLAESIRARDIDATLAADEDAAESLARLRLLQLPQKSLPFTVPAEYDNLPRLQGRATIEMIIQSKTGVRLPDGKTVIKQVPINLVVDGYHTPITAGNFVDLVQKKFYDGMPLQKVEELTIQTGKPISSDGYVDPSSKSIRSIPLELFYKNDVEPVYGITSDDDLRATETMIHPFQAYGALGMARNNEQEDSGSSQFFFLKWKQALIPPGRNTLDGFYSCFGYVTKNEELLSQLTLDDVIISAKIIDGSDNLVLPKL